MDCRLEAMLSFDSYMKIIKKNQDVPRLRSSRHVSVPRFLSLSEYSPNNLRFTLSKHLEVSLIETSFINLLIDSQSSVRRYP